MVILDVTAVRGTDLVDVTGICGTNLGHLEECDRLAKCGPRFKGPPVLRVDPNRPLSISDFLAGRGTFASASREMAQTSGQDLVES